MPEFESSTVVILLSALLGLLVLLTMVLFGMARGLSRIERRIAELAVRPDPAPSSAETAAGGAFETFLNEDAARRKLPKGEQFAAYRKWRQENGLNWSNS